MTFVAEVWEFLQERKKFWLFPLMALVIIFGGLVVLTKGSAIAPLLYTIF